MQPVDLTTLVAVCHEITESCLPARLEQVHQSDRYTIYLSLRTLKQNLWLLLSWHPQAARLHLSKSPPSEPDTFTFSQQIWHQVSGLALVAIKPVSDWERVIDLQFAKRPDSEVLWHLYLEVMGKYSNAIFVNAENAIVTAAHQVSTKQSRVRPIQTGDVYELPPALLETIPSLDEPFEQWRDRLTIVPQSIKRSLLTNYRGVSSVLARSLLTDAGIPNSDTEKSTDSLSASDWQNLFQAWRHWLSCLTHKKFQPTYTEGSYSVIPVQNAETSTVLDLPQGINALLDRYYRQELQRSNFQQLHQQINQILIGQIAKLQVKINDFEERLRQSAQADQLKDRADLLMANLSQWQIGMKAIALPDFQTSELITIALDPTLNAVQNAQALYKQHQKRKRAKEAIAPHLSSALQEIYYLEQVSTSVALLDPRDLDDLVALQEIKLELGQQGYLKGTNRKSNEQGSTNGTSKSNTRSVHHQNSQARSSKSGKSKAKNSKGKRDELPNCYRYKSPSGFEIWVGRNNHQNDLLSFRVATDYDLWFHSQEIPGSHVLLRLHPGTIAETQDLQVAANLAAYHSRARQSDRVPVVFTEPKHVFKPKGAQPGMVVYTHEKIIWGQPTKLREIDLSENPVSRN
ncbi:NFACT RNA binding domain-containing protein [Tumidithrix helvetica PCC 7403]|uniref:Rqc2 family fibronectin-binding protein n=1 Tax=Tumidithrix helvetica TaxID=3457545 RepID=UPI003CB2475C